MNGNGNGNGRENGGERLLEFIRRDRSSFLSDAELIELVLRFAGREEDGDRLCADAIALRDRYIDLPALLGEEYSVLAADPAVGQRGADAIKLIRTLCDRCAGERSERRLERGENRFSEYEARLIAHFRGMRREETAVLYLDGEGNLIAEETVGAGNFTGTELPIRRIAEQALRYSSAAVIVAHNHPGGSVRPSGADEALTGRLKEILGIIDVRLAEHFIISGDRCCPLMYLLENCGRFRAEEPVFWHEPVPRPEMRDHPFGSNPDITAEDRERFLDVWNTGEEYGEKEED